MDEQHGLALAACNADISFAGFAGAVDNAAHHGHLDGLFIALQPLFHLVGDLGAGVLGASAGRTGDDLRSGDREAHGAQDVKACFHLFFRVCSQRHADGVTDALQQHAADAHAAFQQTHLVGTGFGDAHMKRVVSDGAELAVGFHHAGHVGVFDGDNNVVKIEFFQQAHMVQSAFHHGFRGGCAVAGQNVLFQTAAVDADADRDILLLAGIHYCFYPVVIADVARVDADLIHTHVRAGQRGLVVKVDIRHDGDIHCVFDGLDALCICWAGAGHPQDLTASGFAPLGLCHIALDVLHRHIEHGLHRNRVAAANGHIADLHFTFFLPHKGSPFLYCPGNKPENIVVGCKDHQPEQQPEGCKGEHALQLFRHSMAGDAFNDQKYHLAAIQRRKRQ